MRRHRHVDRIDVGCPDCRNLQAPAAETATRRPRPRGGRPRAPQRGTRHQPAVDVILGADQGPAWIAWSVPAVSRQNDDHGVIGATWALRAACSDDEGEFHDWHGMRATSPCSSCSPARRTGRLDRIAFGGSALHHRGGHARPIHWLDGVVPAESVRLLDALIRREAASGRHRRRRSRKDNRVGHRALPALALHDAADADRDLTQHVAAGNPRWLRRDAAFLAGRHAWLRAGRQSSIASVRTDPDASFREHLTFVLTLVGGAGHHDPASIWRSTTPAPASGVRRCSGSGRRQASAPTAALGDAVNNDPDSEVRKRAVFAISQLPRDQSVAEADRSGEDAPRPGGAQAGDVRGWSSRAMRAAVSFFESVLTH